MARIKLITDPSEVPAEHRGIAEEVLQVFGGRLPGPHGVLMHSPAAEAAVVGLSRFYRGKILVESPLKELAAIIVAREKNALYVWAAQVENARHGGLSEETIACIRENVDAAAQNADEALVISFVRQLCRTNRVDDATFEALKLRFGVPWLAELAALVGIFGLLSGVANAFEIEPPKDGDVLPVGEGKP